MSELHNPTWRVLSILDYVSSVGKTTLQEISTELGIPVGTVFPILRTMVAMGYLDCESSSKVYTIGLKTFIAGSYYAHHSSAFAALQKILAETSDLCNETVHFATREGGNVVYLARHDTAQVVRTITKVGSKLPAYGTGLGKALLADMSLDELIRLYPDGLKPLTNNTIVSFQELYEDLATIRKNGFAYEIGESNEFIRCIAIPLRLNGEIKAAMSVSVPIFRYTDELQHRIEDALKNALPRVEALLPYINMGR